LKKALQTKSQMKTPGVQLPDQREKKCELVTQG